MKPERVARRPERMSAHTRQVRARLLNAGFTCLFFLILFFGVTIWQRNEASIDDLKDRLEVDFVQPLQQEVSKLRGWLPVEFPPVDGDHPSDARRYNYPPPEDIKILQQAPDAVLVGHTGRVPLFFQGDVYYVVLYRRGQPGKELSVERWAEEEFYERIIDQQAWVDEQRESRLRRVPTLP